MYVVYQTTNPCICAPSTSSPCPEKCNCLKLCSITVNANSDIAVGPCAKTGILDVMAPEYKHDFCACGEEQGYWSVKEFDQEIFVEVNILPETGILTWVTQGPDSLEKQYGAITLRYCCGGLSAYMCVIIGIKDLCHCPGCPYCEDCDPCTGECADAMVDPSIDFIGNMANTSLNNDATT